ncbi:MAG: pyridoxamine 5'-phosphate oxidase family protein [Gammaproteobacteria bacterium]|nr:pyridoxamine 5'-phosphate oxidase family protein [Gammaproteobacteria bacterium]
MEEKSAIKEINLLVNNRKSLFLSSYNQNQEPLASYAPYVNSDEKSFYIYISELAGHTENINNAFENNKPVSLMLIEDEQESRNIFARNRLTYLCQVVLVPRDSEQWHHIMSLFREKFDQTIDVLMQLSDFKLFSLTAISGKYVSGFGKTFVLQGSEWKLYKPNKYDKA